MKEKEPAVSLNIAILPDKKTQNLAIDMSQTVSQKVDSYFILNTTNLLPHITVYQAHFPKANIKKVQDAVASVLTEVEPFVIEMGGLSVSFESFLFWNCVKSDKLFSLQRVIISKTNHLRNGLILPILSTVTGIPNEERSDIQNYGSLLIGPHYQPHITITRIRKPEDMNRALRLLRKQKNTFKVNSLIIGYLGEHGTVNGIIESIPFR